MGNKNATILNQRVVRIDHERSLLYLKGNVPGPTGGLVKVRDAVKKIDKQVWDLMYPTRMEEPVESLETWDGGDIDRFEIYYHENDVVSGPRREEGD